jgi:hypothetical protein
VGHQRRRRARPDARVGPRLALGLAQQPAPPPQVGRVQAHQRAQQQLLGSGLVEARGPRHHLGGGDDRGHGRLVAQRHLVAGHPDRHARGHQRPLHRAHGMPRPHEHGDVRPPQGLARRVVARAEHEALDVVGDVGGLAARVVVGAHVHLSRSGGRAHRRAVGAQLSAREAGVAAPAQQRCAGRAQHRTEAPRGAEHDQRGLGPRRVAEAVAEAEDAAHVGPAEGVDRLVGVADGHQRRGGGDERLEQAHLHRVGVLVLVDVDRAVLPAQQGADVGALGEHDGPAAAARCSRAPLGVEHREVLLGEGGHRDQAGWPASLARWPPGRLGRALRPGRGHHRAHLRGRPRVPTAAARSGGHATVPSAAPVRSSSRSWASCSGPGSSRSGSANSSGSWWARSSA